LVEVELPGDGVGTAADLVGARPGVAVVMLAEHCKDTDLIAAIRAGALGYLVKDMDITEIPRAIAAAAAGEAVIPRRFVGHILDEVRWVDRADRDPVRVGPALLTRRENEVLDMICQGGSTTQIADRLCLAPVTVRTHVRAIIHKFRVTNRKELIDRVRTDRLHAQRAG
jgi:DNA-binding NarL/FixJ family response regulator